MQPKQNLIILAAIFLCSPLLSQSNITEDYKTIKKNQEWQVEEFASLETVLQTASANYLSTINDLFENAGVKLEGATNRDTKRRQNQLDWMTKVVPIFVSVTEDKKKTKERIDISVNEFSEEFELSFELRKTIMARLTEYAEAYKKYATGYNQLLNGLQVENIPAPALPPPPPPTQQHHRRGSNG